MFSEIPGKVNQILPSSKLQTQRQFYEVKSINGMYYKPPVFVNVTNEANLAHRLKMGNLLSKAKGAKQSVHLM